MLSLKDENHFLVEIDRRTSVSAYLATATPSALYGTTGVPVNVRRLVIALLIRSG